MPPVLVTSPSFLNPLGSHAVTPRFLFSRSVALTHVSEAPSESRQDIFKVLYRGIIALAYLQPVFSTINYVWKWVYPQHLKNTEQAQQELDAEYTAYHEENWAHKNCRANAKLMTKLAKEKPALFAQEYVFNQEVENLRRKVVGVLKKLNPEFYTLNREILGDVEDLT